MHQLIYTSHATVIMSDASLLALLRWAREWNEQNGITGILLYGDQQFIQVIEGDVETVEYLYGHLLRDSRHYDVVELAYGPIAQRNFAQWKMGFHAATSAHLAQVRGYFDPEQLRLLNHNLSTRDELLFELLQGFAHSSSSNWHDAK
ncbi:MAG: BLUF domain-containing protein [Janthinobacterium lividum]